MQLKCTRYSCDDLTLSMTIYSASILTQDLNSHFLDLQCFNSISESSSEKLEEKISWFSYIAEDNSKTVDLSKIWTRTFWIYSVSIHPPIPLGFRSLFRLLFCHGWLVPCLGKVRMKGKESVVGPAGWVPGFRLLLFHSVIYANFPVLHGWLAEFGGWRRYRWFGGGV